MFSRWYLKKYQIILQARRGLVDFHFKRKIFIIEKLSVDSLIDPCLIRFSLIRELLQKPMQKSEFAMFH